MSKTVFERPDDVIFADGAKANELTGFPDLYRGWGVTIDQTKRKPPMSWMNGLFNRADKHINYLLQKGVAEWNSDMFYPQGSFVNVSGTLFYSTRDTSGEPPLISANTWKRYGVNLDDLQAIKEIIPIIGNTPDTDEVPSMKFFGVQRESAGWQILPSGLIIQWGVTVEFNANGGSHTPLPIAFPNAILHIIACDITLGSSPAGAMSIVGGSIADSSTTSVYIRGTRPNNGSPLGDIASFIVIGY